MVQRLTRIGDAGLLVLALAGACHDAGSSSTTTSGADFAGKLGAALCASGPTCCKSTWHAADCAGAGAFVSSVVPGSPGGTFDASAASACLAALTAASAPCDPDLTAFAAAMDTCQTVYPGTKNDGDACSDATECAAVPNTARYCDGQCGHDGNRYVSALGGPCSIQVPMAGAPDYHCDPASYLWCSTKTLTCAAPVPHGGNCDNAGGSAGTCVAGDACVGKNGKPPTCITGHAAGEACGSSQCDLLSDPMVCACGIGTFCDDSGTGKCTPVVSPGGACANSSACLGVCTTSGRCVTAGQELTWGDYCY